MLRARVRVRVRVRGRVRVGVRLGLRGGEGLVSRAGYGEFKRGCAYPALRRMKTQVKHFE